MGNLTNAMPTLGGHTFATPQDAAQAGSAMLPSADSMMGPDVLNPKSDTSKLPPQIGSRTPSFSEASNSGPGGTPNALSKGLTTKGKLLTMLLNAGKGAAAGAGSKTFGEGFQQGGQLPFIQAMQKQGAHKGELDAQLEQAQIDNIPVQRQQQAAAIEHTAADTQRAKAAAAKDTAEIGAIPGREALAQLQAAERAQQDAALRANMEENRKLEGQRVSESTRHNQASESDTRRGQDMTNSRMRDANTIARDAKIDQKHAADDNQLAGFNSSMDRLGTAANELLNHPGVAGITGLRGKIPNIPGTDAANAEALSHTLKSQVAFSVLQDMRNSSKTGGALGQVSDKEEQMLSSNIAALDNAQSEDAYKHALRSIVEYAEAAKGRAKAAVDRSYGAGTDAKPTPKSSGGKSSDLPPKGAKIRDYSEL